ncbi:MAG: hypothetical protein NT013_20210 [Planctomycetia bacterium]|nr:hypothetical protein [Planctomycetia bacterium]
MNGRKTLRCRAAVVGLALLMGASFLGCHAGPRFFAKKDRDERTAKKEFADKGKFINKKKVRPESDYLKNDGLSEERIAKNDGKIKSKSSNSDRFQNADELDRSVAARKRSNDTDDEKAPAAKSTASKQLTDKESTKSDVARRDAIRRPASKEVADSLFDEPLPEKKTITRPPIKSSFAAKNRNIDEDPFKNSVVNPFENKRAADKVATVNFNELEDDDDDESDDDDELEIPARAVKSNIQAAKKTVDQQSAAAATEAKRKFLPEDDVDNMKSSAVATRRRAEQVAEPVTRSTQQMARSANKARGNIDNSVSKNRQQTQETLNDWRRELDQAAATDDETPVMNTAAPTPERSQPSQNSGHISQTTLDEFAPNKKSQGAVLNGDLILDTTNVPTRFQRTESSGSGNNTSRSNASDSNSRTRPNSGASIDIVPGSTQNRSRPSGQIMLQSLSDHDEETSQAEQAVYEQSSSAEAGEGLLPLLMPLGNDSDAVSYFGSNEVTDSTPTSAVNGPRLMPLDDQIEIQQTSEGNNELNNTVRKTEERTNSAFGWGTLSLVLGGLAAAALTGLGLRRRKEVLVPVPVRASVH